MAVRKLIPQVSTAPGSLSRSPASLGVDVDVCSLDPTQSQRPARGIYIGTAGTLVVQHPGDRNNSGTQQNVTWANLAAGSFIPCNLCGIVASGTTVTSVILFW